MSNDEDMEVAEGGEDIEDGETTNETQEVYLPGRQLAEDEELVCDQSAYIMYHQAQTGAPCLSFDIVRDKLGDNRDRHPLTAYMVAGTQAPQAHTNNVIVMKLSNLHRTFKEGDDDDDDDDDSESEEEDNDDGKQPKMAGALIRHQGCVNRIRTTVIEDVHVAATWSELGRVNVWNLMEQLQAVDSEQALSKYNKENGAVTPLFTFSGHQKEGFALDWSPTSPGVLATGDCRRDIHIWKPTDKLSSWSVDQRPLAGHTDSVEDLQWSPNEPSVLASCSVDRSVRIWDTRAPPQKACMLTAAAAHDGDVNVISWNRHEPFVVSGGDDGVLHVWDLRRFGQAGAAAAAGGPLATFKHHTGPVTTVEWHPADSAVFASGGADDQIALWDLSVERDADAELEDVAGVPPQLLFIHQGQKDIKELHWHAQLTGVLISTAESGFNIFRTISV